MTTEVHDTFELIDHGDGTRVLARLERMKGVPVGVQLITRFGSGEEWPELYVDLQDLARLGSWLKERVV